MELEDLKDIRYAIEANRFEQMALWEKWKDRIDWKEDNGGLWYQIGKVADNSDMPVCISLFRAQLDGEWVLFYHATSNIVDHDMMEKWLLKRMPKSTSREITDAMNFHNCVHGIHETRTC